MERVRHCDLAIVGGGFTGLWAALQAAEENPDRSIVLLEGDRIAEGATGRNGGFCAASLTHGLGNGLDRYADELPELLRMGTETLDAICATAKKYGIDADIERTGELDIAEVLLLRHELTRMPTAPLPNVVADLGGVRFMDCSVLRTLVSVHLSARTQGGCLRLVAPQREPLHLLQISRLDHVFCMHDTLDAAVEPVCARHVALS